MLSRRLDTLETDLKLLLTMQDLLLNDPDLAIGNTILKHSGTDLVRSQVPNEIPERDVSKRSKDKGKNRNKASVCSVNSENHCHEAFQKNCYANGQIEGCTLHLDRDMIDKEIGLLKDLGYQSNHSNRSINAADQSSYEIKLKQEFHKETVSLKVQIDEEKRLRKEVEESAKKVYVKLQKVEDELTREKQTKESLLLGTLQLKNLVQGFNSKIKDTEKELNDSKGQIQQLKSELENVLEEKFNILNRLQRLSHELGFGDQEHVGIHQLRHTHQPENVEFYIGFLRNKFHELIQKASNLFKMHYEITRSIGQEHEEVNKLASQFNNVVGRCAKLERERDELIKRLQEFHTREDRLKNLLHESEMSLSTMESSMLKKQIEFECVIQKLESEIQIEKEKSTMRISEYSSVIQRSKDLLLSLKNERDENRTKVRELREIEQTLDVKFKSVEKEKQNLINELDSVKNRLAKVLQEKSRIFEESKDENLKLKMSIKRTESEKRRCIELLSDMKNQLVLLKNKYDHEKAMHNVEMERLKNENLRLDENFRVLQKVSEDQGHTIQKLRGDLESLKEGNFKLESQIRDYESTENQLIRKLDQSEKQCDRYIKHIDELQEKIEKYSEDVRQHDCDDYVDSKYKRKLMELQETFQIKGKEWEDSFKRADNEKNEAITTARKALQKIDEIKEAHNFQITQIKSSYQAEVCQFIEQQRKMDSEKSGKIIELQSELDRIKLSSSQIQRALSTKLQQLQAALSICLGEGLNQNNNSSLGLHESLHQLYQQHQMGPSVPISAYGNAGSLGFAGCANNNGAYTNLLLNPNTNGTSGHQNPTQITTCFGNSNVNGCTSGTS